ncbi:MAG: YciI family protein [Acidimicrobiia bacterium]
MPKYLLSVHYVDGVGASELAEPVDMNAVYEQVADFNQRMQDSGAWVFGGGLMTPDTATVVRTDSGQRVVTDGPFSEAKEQIGGFWILEAPDLDAALDLADQASRACLGPVEIRPFQPEE